MQAGVFGIFGVLSLVIAAVGLYGVMAYGVEQRRREMALKLALGAPPKMVAGFGGARSREPGGGRRGGRGLPRLGRERIARKVCSTRRVRATRRSLSGVAVTLIAVACLAALAPALRATRVDPLAVLHDD